MEQSQSTVKDIITKDMTIGDVVQKYPACIETLQEAGVHCVGCHVAYHETLEQGFKGHGTTDEEVDHVVGQMNRAVAESEAEGPKDIIVTNKAADKLKSVLKEHDKEGHALRVMIVSGGCSGHQYGMELDESSQEGDKVFEEKGVKIIIAGDQFDQLKGSKIDYVDSLQGGGFKITNPNVTSSCGCGQSFA